MKKVTHLDPRKTGSKVNLAIQGKETFTLIPLSPAAYRYFPFTPTLNCSASGSESSV